ncbi:hypothetical protein ACCO45_000712 [Purpureocillium lilacinum]|uniref:Uncharacterized protein n=1 Tax=Purpureocillium lilacinum TaxID=33203 RepID=A0ACC4E665_PURLI
MHGGDATPGHLTHAERGRGEHANRAVCLHVVSVAKGSRAPHSAALPGALPRPSPKAWRTGAPGILANLHTAPRLRISKRQLPHPCARPSGTRFLA